MSDSAAVRNIIVRAGGPQCIADASNGDVQKEAVYKWAKSGIPDRHWPLVMKLADATADEMLAANVAVRAAPSSTPQSHGVPA